LGPSGAILRDGNSSITKRQTRAKAIAERAAQIEHDLNSVKLPTIALVELDDASKDRPEDPKDAIRWGLARSGRVSQFITPSDEDESEHERSDKNTNIDTRAKSSVRDGLRQLGYLAGSPAADAASMLGIGPSLEVVGLWYLVVSGRPQVHIPVLVRIDPSGFVWSKYFGERQWLPYREALISIAQKQMVLGKTQLSKDNVQAFVKQSVDDVLSV